MKASLGVRLLISVPIIEVKPKKLKQDSNSLRSFGRFTDRVRLVPQSEWVGILRSFEVGRLLFDIV